MLTIYLAGPLFSVADQVFNIMLSQSLEQRGYEVILPQLFEGDLPSIIRQCHEEALSADVLVANMDGDDADSGTAKEVGIRVGANAGPTILFRTDFRTDAEKQSGINAMFIEDIVLLPCVSISEMAHATSFIDRLAQLIDERISGPLLRPHRERGITY